jgi:hypothetical protein
MRSADMRDTECDHVQMRTGWRLGTGHWKIRPAGDLECDLQLETETGDGMVRWVGLGWVGLGRVGLGRVGSEWVDLI